jgi:hypothetical protein
VIDCVILIAGVADIVIFAGGASSRALYWKTDCAIEIVSRKSFFACVFGNTGITSCNTGIALTIAFQIIVLYTIYAE